jgi:hypothetical protein
MLFVLGQPPAVAVVNKTVVTRETGQMFFSALLTLLAIHYTYICDRIREKGPIRAHFNFPV